MNWLQEHFLTLFTSLIAAISTVWGYLTNRKLNNATVAEKWDQIYEERINKLREEMKAQRNDLEEIYKAKTTLLESRFQMETEKLIKQFEAERTHFKNEIQAQEETCKIQLAKHEKTIENLKTRISDLEKK